MDNCALQIKHISKEYKLYEKQVKGNKKKTSCSLKKLEQRDLC